jgi:hypothetical protein
MRLTTYTLSCFLLCFSLHASADLISPGIQEAHERLNANPDDYDSVDNFCKDKKAGTACSMPGTVFAGGGEGVCNNHINRDKSIIEMSCVRKEEVYIERNLPDWGSSTSPVDQFCHEITVGNPCTIELKYKGNTEHLDGICKHITETRTYYRYGNQREYRTVLRCEPPTVVEHIFTPVSWRKKLLK